MPSPPFHNSWILPCLEYIIPPHRTLLGPASVSCMVTGDRERESVCFNSSAAERSEVDGSLCARVSAALFVGVSEVEVLWRERPGQCYRGCYY